jgi:MerC mercury resistance protein
MKLKINWDAFGIATSLACAIHCALLPLFLSSLPIFGYNIIENNWFEYLMIALAFAVGTYSLYHGRKKHHHSWTPMIIFTAGIILLLSKVIWHHLELWLLIPAVALIITAHYLNYKMCRVHNHAHSDDCNH